jgi:hypothetical protein
VTVEVEAHLVEAGFFDGNIDHREREELPQDRNDLVGVDEQAELIA